MKKIDTEKYIHVLVWTLVIMCFSLLSGCSTEKITKDKSDIAYSIKDYQGYETKFTKKPHRIISMSISTDEILMELVETDRIIALSRLVDDPGISNIVEEAKKIGARVDGRSPEAIMALQPDLILIPDFVKIETINSLRDMGLNVYVYKTPNSLAEVKSCIIMLGVAVGEKEAAERIVKKMDNRLNYIREKIGDIPYEQQRRVVFMRPNGAYYSPQASFNDVCKYAKVRNALAELNYQRPVYVGPEEIVRLNPEAFLIAAWNYDGQHAPENMKQGILNNPGYQTTSAVKSGTVYILPAKNLMCVSQYLIEAIEYLAEEAYGIEI